LRTVAIKEGWQQIILLLPLLVGVEVFRSYTNAAYLRHVDILSREVAVEVSRLSYDVEKVIPCATSSL
jgi:hypothetical protein